jgi:N-acetyl-gamma-glutamyl-phosphate reductase
VKRYTAAVYGATGFLGSELLRRLLLHPDVELVRVHAADHLGEPLGAAQPHLEQRSSLLFESLPTDEAQVAPVDVAFLALPHEVSWQVVARLDATQTRIIDCSGAFRVQSAEDYQLYYGRPHPLPNLLPEFIYGLTEQNRERLRGARFCASPGCFATAIELGLLPLARAGVLKGAVHTVAATGSSGAGSLPLATTHHPSRAGNLRCYKPFTHPHTPEIEAALTDAGATDLRLSFVPIAAPLVRGIFATSFVNLPASTEQRELDDWTQACFAQSAFVRSPVGRLPEVVAVAGSNYAEVKLVIGPVNGKFRPVTALSALDNLLKGGAGQAVQNMNLMLGLDETSSLEDPGAYP